MEDLLPRVTNSAAAVAQTVERSASAALPLPAVSTAGSTAALSVRTAGTAAEPQTDLSALSERMDRLLDYLYDTEPVLRLDGRTFGRMVREYA